MDTNEPLTPVSNEVVERLKSLAAGVELPARFEPGDATRAGLEAMMRQTLGSARALSSRGRLRFTGAGVSGHSADLEDVGLLSSAWQKAVTAAGAALEGVQAVRGRLPNDVVLRTKLMLTASPAPGSVVFLVEPKQSPLLEVEPGGQPALTEDLAERPLADRASETLVELLATAAAGKPETADAISGQLRELGPRVGSALNNLAHVIDSSNVTLDVTWQEPALPTHRAVVTPSQAKFISQVVEGRGLDAVRDTLTGTLRTISDSQTWLLDLGEEAVKLHATELAESELTKWKVHDLVDVDVRIAMQERPDGRVSKHYTILGIRPAAGPPTLYAD